MLNSRYAPVVALAVLGVVVIVVLGWFLAINPRLNERADLQEQADTVRTNTQQIQSMSVRLDEYAALVASGDEVNAVMELNAPSAVDVSAFRTRLWDAFDASGAELVSLSSDSASGVPALTVDASVLLSTQVAGLFQTGPTVQATGDDETAAPATWSPVVTARTGEIEVTSQLLAVPFSMQVAGSAAENYDFLKELANPEKRIFAISAITLTARPGGSADIPGVSAADDGDAVMTLDGVLYVSEPDLTVVDEELSSAVGAPNGKAFIDGETADAP